VSTAVRTHTLIALLRVLVPPTRADVGAARDGGQRAAAAAGQLLAANIEKGILPAEGMDALARLLARDLQPEQLVSPVPLPGLAEALAKAQASGGGGSDGAARFARPELDTEYVAPRDELETTLVRFVEELLGIDAVNRLPAAVILEAAAEEKLHLRVDAPHVVVGPAPQGCKHLRVDPQQEGVAGRHGREGSSGAGRRVRDQL
jgi:hypothetical protein